MERTGYRPYGEEAAVQQPLTLPEAKGFIGERFDGDAGLQYLNARYYDPRLGMFVQPDWWEVTQAGVGTNRYAYAFGDPVNGRDPKGNQTWIDPIPGPVWQDNAVVVGGIVVGGIIGGIIMGGRPGTLVDLPPIDQRPPPLAPTKVISKPAKAPVGLQGLAPGSGSIVFNEETGEVETEGKLKPGTYVDTETGKIYEVDDDGKIKELGYDGDGLSTGKETPLDIQMGVDAKNGESSGPDAQGPRGGGFWDKVKDIVEAIAEAISGHDI
mgnify:FL=1